MSDGESVTFSDAYGNEFLKPGNGGDGYWTRINPKRPPLAFMNDRIVQFGEDEPVTPEPTVQTDVPKQSEQDHLLEARGLEYADAWIVTSEVVGFLMEHGHFNVLGRLIGRDAPYLYAWITVLCKLIRALNTPRKADHWRDIAGYAILVAEHIETGSRGR